MDYSSYTTGNLSNDSIGIIFLMLAIFVGIPLFVTSLIFSIKLRGKLRFIPRILAILVGALTLAAIINCSIGIESYSDTRTYHSTIAGEIYYNAFHWRHPCSWVGMGLCCGAMLFGIAALTLALIFRHMEKVKRLENPEPVQNKQRVVHRTNRSVGLNYIDEIKQLKELLDCGAITQEEYDAKKKEALER